MSAPDLGIGCPRSFHTRRRISLGRRFSGAGLGVFIASCMTVPGWEPDPARAAPAVWEMPSEYPASTLPGEGMALFSARVAELSGGRLLVKTHFDAADGFKSAEIIRAVRDDRVQAGDAFAGALDGIDPIFALSSLPFLATSIEEARLLGALARPVYQDRFRAEGQRLLYMTPWPGSGIWSSRAVENPGDLAALSIRTYDAASAQVLRAAGAKATPLSFADAMPHLKDGSVNAVLSSGDGGAGRRLWEFLPYFSPVNYAMPLSFATVNAARYAALPDDLRQVVDQAAAEVEARQWRTLETRLGANLQRMRDNGVTIAAPSQPLLEALKAAGADVVADWRRRAGAVGADVLSAYEQR